MEVFLVIFIFRKCLAVRRHMASFWGLAVRHSHHGTLWLVEAVVRSSATWLSRRAVKSIFALKRVRVSVSCSECRTVSPRS